MTSLLTLTTVLLYLALLFVVAWFSARNADGSSFFTGNRRSPAWVVALAMVGAPMTGVTFISVPGMVGQSSFAYLQMVLGFIAGSAVIAYLLIPLYYKHKVTSLYEYLDNRFGLYSHRSGAWLFLVSKLSGTALKTFVACVVIQQLVCEPFDIPFWATTSLFMLLVWLYTYRGGVRSVVWIDAVKTLCMTICLLLAIYFVQNSLCNNFAEVAVTAYDRGYTKIFFTEDWNDSRHFVKMFLAGLFMIVAMTGLDQDMMQRALSSRTQRSAQRNIVLASLLQAVIIALLLSLGALLCLYLAREGLSVGKPDETFAFVATREGMPHIIAVLLAVGVMSATFSSTAGALTSLTTSFTVDILRNKEIKEGSRKWLHLVMAVVTALLILAFEEWSNESTINLVYRVASYTYGPLLGMFLFGIFSRREVRDEAVPWIVVAAPILSLLLDYNSERWFGGYEFGFGILLVNAALTIGGLYCISKNRARKSPFLAHHLILKKHHFLHHYQK